MNKLALAFAVASVAFGQDPLAGLDDYIAHAMATFQVPGIAVAVVKDGKVVLAKGYGVRQLNEPAKVDEQTLFGIGSNTKAFTSAALAIEKYAGAYADAWYGDIGITLEEGKLVMRFSHTPGLTGDMEHWQYDTFKVRWRDRSLAADAFVTFALNAEGGIKEATIKPVSPLTDFSFDFQDLTLVPAKK